MPSARYGPGWVSQRRWSFLAAFDFALGVMFCVPGTLWLMIQTRWREEPPAGEIDAAVPEDEVLEGRIG